MRVLAIDTATDRGTVAVLSFDEGKGTVLAEASASVDARHGETLLPHVEDVVSRAGGGPRSIELVAVGIGPGSFTGVRVGLATAKGLALGLSIPLIGVSTLDVVAAGVEAEEVVVVLSAKKDEVFAARFVRHGGQVRRVGDAIYGAHEAVAQLLGARPLGARPGEFLVGIGARDPRFLAPYGPATLADPALDLPNARVLAELGMRRFSEEGPSDRATLVPLYVRGADAVVPTSLVPFVTPASER
jgi:tRNA threonylcarbamoyladenosine biosynthesis protein TsaB